jgi:hypothetical protein
MIEIKKPTTPYDPDYVTGKKEIQYFKFNSDLCDASVTIQFDRQINSSWTGRTEKIDEKEVTELRSFYRIGLSGKSHDGGLPIFDRVNCEKCGANYITYCGVTEFSNSAFAVTVNGIIRE